jgi:hypothetical protein
VYQVCVDTKKTLRVDLARIIVESTRSTVQLTMQRADSTRKAYFYSKAFVSNHQSCGKMKIKTTTKKKQKAKHDPGTCISKVYVYYDVFKVIF